MPRRHQKIGDEKLLEDLKRVNGEVGFLSRRVYERRGKYSSTTVAKRFGSWNDAKKEIGANVKKISRSSYGSKRRKEAIKNLKDKNLSELGGS